MDFNTYTFKDEVIENDPYHAYRQELQLQKPAIVIDNGKLSMLAFYLYCRGVWFEAPHIQINQNLPRLPVLKKVVPIPFSPDVSYARENANYVKDSRIVYQLMSRFL